MANFSG